MKISTILDHEVRERIPLILYASHADFQATNITPGLIGEGTGGVTEFLKRELTHCLPCRPRFPAAR